MEWKRLLGLGDEKKALEELLTNSLRTFNRPIDPLGMPLAAKDYLPSVGTEKLFDIDERLRAYYSYSLSNWPSTALQQIVSAKIEPPLRQSLLFISASHTDGRVRQRTLWSLPQFPGRLTFAIALIRCADWAEEVRFAAQNATTQLLDLCSGEDVVAVWPLVIRLRFRSRVSSEWLREHVEKWMLRSESEPWLRLLLNSRNATVRAWAFAQSIEANASPLTDILDAAIKDPSPAIGLHAFRYIQRRGDEDRVRSLAQTGLSAPHPIIRRESLRALSALDDHPPRELLYQALSDRSSGVRALSAFLLRERYSEDAAALWRSMLDAECDRPPLGALMSLADNAQEQDIGRMRRWIGYPSSVVQIHCLRGLLKANAQLSDQEFTQLVTSGGTRTRHLLAEAIRRGQVPLGVKRATFALGSETTTPTTSMYLQELLAELNHWDRLSLILQLHLEGINQSDWWQSVLADWVHTSSRYAPLGPVRRAGLLELLHSRQSDIDETSFITIETSIRRH